MSKNLMDHDWPVDISFTGQVVGRMAVKGMIGVIYKFVLMPSYKLEDGKFRVVSWSFVPREDVLSEKMIKHLEALESQMQEMTK